MLFWEQEDAVTVISAKSMKDDVAVGKITDVVVGKNSYPGKIQAMGKLDALYLQL